MLNLRYMFDLTFLKFVNSFNFSLKKNFYVTHKSTGKPNIEKEKEKNAFFIQPDIV